MEVQYDGQSEGGYKRGRRLGGQAWVCVGGGSKVPLRTSEMLKWLANVH